MRPLKHLLFGIFFAIISLFLFPKIGFLGFFIILLSNFLIDVDHYLFYAIKNKNWNLKKAYFWHVKNGEKILSFPKKKRKEFHEGLYFLHGIEFLTFLFFFYSISNSLLFVFVFIGFAFHLVLDSVFEINLKGKLSRFSLIYDFSNFDKLEHIWDAKLLKSWILINNKNKRRFNLIWKQKNNQ